MAYNPVCLLQKLVQVLHAEDVRLDWLRIVAREHLIEDRSDVHGAVLRLRLCWLDDDAPAASRLSQQSTTTSLREPSPHTYNQTHVRRNEVESVAVALKVL